MKLCSLKKEFFYFPRCMKIKLSDYGATENVSILNKLKKCANCGSKVFKRFASAFNWRKCISNYRAIIKSAGWHLHTVAPQVSSGYVRGLGTCNIAEQQHFSVWNRFHNQQETAWHTVIFHKSAVTGTPQNVLGCTRAYVRACVHFQWYAIPS